MHKVIVDNELRTKLHDLNAEVELCDESGRIMGCFLPAELYQRLLYAWAKVQVTPEELEAARREPGGYTTQEAISHLEKLAYSPMGRNG